VFIAVYGALMPRLLARPSRDTLKWLAAALIGTVFIFDLYRIQDSSGDLYTTTLRGLTQPKINDANSEFVHFHFYGNVLVVAIALWIVCMAPGLDPRINPGSGPGAVSARTFPGRSAASARGC
jgi:hypothetical protein